MRDFNLLKSIKQAFVPKVQDDWTGQEQPAVNFAKDWLSKRKMQLSENIQNAMIDQSPNQYLKDRIKYMASAVQNKYGINPDNSSAVGSGIGVTGQYNKQQNNIAYYNDPASIQRRSEYAQNFTDDTNRIKEDLLFMKQAGNNPKTLTYPKGVSAAPGTPQFDEEYAKLYRTKSGRPIELPVLTPDQKYTSLHERTHAGNFTAQEAKIKSITGFDENAEYLKKPTEIYSRLMEMRAKLNLDPSKKYTPEEIEKMRKSDFKPAKDLFNNFDNETMSKLLNDVAYKQNQNKYSNPTA